MTRASRAMRLSSTAAEMPAWPPPTTRTSGSRPSKAISAWRSSNQSRPAKSRACDTGAWRLASQILLKSSVVEIVQATGAACAGDASLMAPMPGPWLVSKQMIASITSRPATTAWRGASAVVSTRNSLARTSEARRLSSWQRFSFPLDVASCQEIPNRLRQWLSGRKNLANAASSPLVSARPKARTHCVAVSSAEGASFSNINALPPVFRYCFYARYRALQRHRLLNPELVEIRRGLREQRGLFGFAVWRGDALEGVDDHLIAALALVRREIAFEHAARRAERLDSGFDIGTPCRRRFFRRRWHRTLVKVITEQAHRQPAEFNHHIGAFGDVPDRGLPLNKGLLTPVGKAAAADRAAAMIEHDLGVRKGAGEIGQFCDLRMKQPCVKA